MNIKQTASKFSPAYLVAAGVIVLMALVVSRVTDPTADASNANDYQRIEALNVEISELQKQLLDEGIEYDKHREIMEEAQATMSYHADMAKGIREEVAKRQNEINAITSRQKPVVEEAVTEEVKK